MTDSGKCDDYDNTGEHGGDGEGDGYDDDGGGDDMMTLHLTMKYYAFII